MAKQVKPKTPPRWYAVFVTKGVGEGGTKDHFLRMSLGKLNLTVGRRNIIPPGTSTTLNSDWIKGWKIVEALCRCIRGPYGLYTDTDAFLEVVDIRTVGRG